MDDEEQYSYGRYGLQRPPRRELYSIREGSITETWTITVRNKWGERIYFAYRLLFEWPSAKDRLP